VKATGNIAETRPGPVQRLGGVDRPGSRERRVRAKQATLAERAGFTREYVNKIEAGRYDPPLSTINALAKALRVKVARLVE